MQSDLLYPANTPQVPTTVKPATNKASSVILIELIFGCSNHVMLPKFLPDLLDPVTT